MNAEELGLMHFWQAGDIVTHSLTWLLLAMSVVSWYFILAKAWSACLCKAHPLHAHPWRRFEIWRCGADWLCQGFRDRWLAPIVPCPGGDSRGSRPSVNLSACPASSFLTCTCAPNCSGRPLPGFAGARCCCAWGYRHCTPSRHKPTRSAPSAWSRPSPRAAHPT